MKRTDIHRPAVIEPTDYEFVAYDYLPGEGDVLGAAFFLAEERARKRAHMARTGGKYSSHEHGGSCHVCGAHAIYTATFYHKSNVYIRTGLECAEKMEHYDADKFRAKVRDALEAVAGKKKAKATLEAAGFGEAWDMVEALNKRWADHNAAWTAWHLANPDPVLRTDGPGHVGEPKAPVTTDAEHTIRDIVNKLVKYGSISDKAMNYIGVLIDRHKRAGEIAAARAAETEAAAPVPVTDKRIKIAGKVLSVREPDMGSRFPAWKMLVKCEPGNFKLWGTIPAALTGIKRGDEVEFEAAVKVSDRDPKFGFFSRPTKAKSRALDAAA